MTSFRDQVMLKLGDPAAFGALLRPAEDTDRQLIRTMLAASHDLSALRVDRVRDVAVDALELQHPLRATARTTGTWTRTVPSYARTELALDAAESRNPVWIDVLARLRVTVVAEIDPAGAESVVSEAADTFTTLDEFRRQFPFVDLDRFMAEHGITTVEQLRDAYQYLRTTVRLRAAAPFDPDDPANAYTLNVALAALAVDPFDLAEGLRAARMVRETSRELTGAPPKGVVAECTAAYAVAVVFSAEGPGKNGITSATVGRLLAGAGVAALFLDTS
ncbi:hypothetical protein ACOT81_37355 [Streptomyces sp. WI04-05B]|uniref:hypothetical protein n=1 Tax=Streptomyces TaxID=1883 RepID=UPI0029AE700B|nr:MULTISPECIES: hypothetical protein [unclassified Streptomyces]MDX2547447.1 hypothetical protein [Streptomyces sp. WI04-05B]MDX2586294.1 hypothetical protein [Streptomyces sp. WI04-05A]